MALKKLKFAPGINKEVTRYASEGGWYECDKVRFRQGFPEKIGGWQRISDNTYQGVCRSLFSWNDLGGVLHRGVGTHLKFYIELGGAYYDVTPIRKTTSSGAATFSSTNGSSTITVTDSAHDALTGDFVTFSSAATLGTSTITATVLNQEYQIDEVIDGNSYTITAKDTNGDEVVSDETVSGGGGGSTSAEYQLNTGYATNQPASGWSAGSWSEGSWSQTTDPSSTAVLRLYSQSNFGEDLLFTSNGGKLCVWDTSQSTSIRATLVEDNVAAEEPPISQNILFVSDTSRFVFALGTNEVFSSTFDPMLIRWSDQESYLKWSPSITNQSGSLRLSRGSQIVSVLQARQEVLVWTDTALYSLQYVGAPIVWGSQLVGTDITIASQNATVTANGTTYWMGKNQFYIYSGQTQVLPCTLQRHVFEDLNPEQLDQIFAGSNEEFYEIWWFYPSRNSSTIDKYVVYNYKDQIWYYGTMARTAWSKYATEVYTAGYNYNLIQQEIGCDDQETTTISPINAQITSSEIALNEGNNFSFMWRILPDISFDNSTSAAPSADLTVYGLKKMGSGYLNPVSEGGVSTSNVAKVASSTVEAFTDQVNMRVRARLVVYKVSSDETGVQWQLGTPTVDLRTDGRQ